MSLTSPGHGPKLGEAVVTTDRTLDDEPRAVAIAVRVPWYVEGGSVQSDAYPARRSQPRSAARMAWCRLRCFERALASTSFQMVADDLTERTSCGALLSPGGRGAGGSRPARARASPTRRG